jgi:DNA-directed RNA polymerase subunit RPC12/RpoP
MEEDAGTLVQHALEGTARADTLRQELDVYTKGKEEQRVSVYTEFEHKIHVLQQEAIEAQEAIQQDVKVHTEQVNAKIAEAMKPRYQAERILAFLRLGSLQYRKQLDFPDAAIHNREQYLEPLGYLFNDQFLVIKLFIAENEKPKNKYSLLAFGRCLFPSASDGHGLLELPYSYGLPTHEDGWFSVQASIRDMPTIEELKTYLSKNKDNMIKWLTGQYGQVKQEYLSILAHYRVEDFRALLAWLCTTCGRFYTQWEMRNYHRDDDTRCPECGQTMTDLRPPKSPSS